MELPTRWIRNFSFLSQYCTAQPVNISGHSYSIRVLRPIACKLNVELIKSQLIGNSVGLREVARHVDISLESPPTLFLGIDIQGSRMIMILITTVTDLKFIALCPDTHTSGGRTARGRLRVLA